MIWARKPLASITGSKSYLAEAVASARAVSKYLADGAGVYADLQAENDVVEPLIEAMYLLATTDQQSFARTWLLNAASAAAADQTAGGAYGRFFDGPPPRAPLTAWQVNRGISLLFAAAKLYQARSPSGPRYWHTPAFIPGNRAPP